MHLIIHFSNGQGIHVVDSWAAFAQKHYRQGLIYLDGKEPGRLTVLNLAVAEQFSDEEWDAMQQKAEEQKKADEEQRKAAAVKFAEDKDRQDKINRYDRWHEQSWYKKLWRKCPHTLPPAKVEAPAVAQAPATAPEERAGMLGEPEA